MSSRADVPGAYVNQLVDLVARWDVSADELLEGSGISALLVRIPATRVPLTTYRALIRRAHELTGEDGLGFCMGLAMRASTHGFVGFAAMTAGTIREAIQVAVRFSATRTQAIALTFEEDSESAYLGIQERVPLEDALEFMVSGLMVGLAQIGEAITGQRIEGVAEVTFAEPPAYTRFRHLVPGQVRFLQPHNRLVFPRRALELPLVMADPVAARLAREQCERELDALGAANDVVSRVRLLLPRAEAEGGGYRTLEEVADRLHVSARTLKRQLAGHETTYSDVLDGVRRERALQLLSSAEARVEAVAAELGYSDTANFTRAFKRWTGSTPAAFKRR
jgi:AraC-like DNA-binding protein